MNICVTYPPKSFLLNGPKSISNHEIENMAAVQRAKRQEELNKGLLVPLKTTVFRNLSIMERYERLHDEITFKGMAYVKSSIVISDGQPYVQYVRKGIECPEGCLVSRVHVPHLAILAEYCFGVTHAGLDSYLATFGRFIGVYLDSNNAILSQLKGKYETNLNQSHVNFLLNLEKEIERLLTNPQLTWEQIFDLWEDQRIVRDEIVNSYCEQYIP